MTPKQKAKELIDKFSLVGLQQRNEGIACALIAVDEMIVQNGEYWLLKKIDTDFYKNQNGYLFQVKEEINGLSN
jgi:hypothetical protein